MPNSSIKNERLYKDLRKQGDSKEKAARISNAAAGRGKSSVSRKGGKSRSYSDWTVPELKSAPKSLACPAIRVCPRTSSSPNCAITDP